MLPSHTSISGSATAAVSTTGAPLDIAGQATLTVSLGMFTVTHEFIVVRHLTVDCLLGADFLKRYKAVIDCGNSALYFTNRNHQYTIPVPTTGKLNVPCDITSALVDPSTQSPMYICVARSMSPLANAGAALAVWLVWFGPDHFLNF